MELLGCVRDVTVHSVKHGKMDAKTGEIVKLEMTAFDHGVQSKIKYFEFMVDTGVNKMTLSEAQWLQLQSVDRRRNPKLKKSNTRFTPFGMSSKLECISCSKCELIAQAGAKIATIVYVVRGVGESLLGLGDAKELGIVKVTKEGETCAVRQLSELAKEAVPDITEEGADGRMQEEVI